MSARQLPLRRPQRFVAGLALLVGAAVVTVLVLGAGSSSPGTGTSAAATSGSTSVQRRNLVATDTESGTVSYSGQQTVYDRLSGTITWLPHVGQVIRPGQALYRVDGKPVLLMDGTTPAYRTLSSSDTSGADVLELNRNLVRLGFDAGAITVDDEWQPATTSGVELLQESLGEAETGKLTLGQVVFLPGSQLVSTVEASVGGTGGSSAPNGTTGASTPVAPAAPEFVSLTKPASPTSSTTPTTSTSTTSPSSTPSPSSGHHHSSSPHGSSSPSTGAAGGETLAALSNLLRAENAQLRAELQELRAAQQGHSPSSPSGHPSSGHPSSGHPSSGSSHPSSGSSHPSSSSHSPSSGGGNGGGGNASPVLETTSTKLVVTVNLPASSQSEARVGEHVTVQMPDGGTVRGRITAVSSVAQSSSSDSGNGGSGSGGNGGSGSSSSTIPVTITLSGHHSGVGLDQASVSVNFVQQKASHVLSVPVTALLATAGGGYAVQEAAAPHRLLPVTTGLFAAGDVQINGSGIYPGLRVTSSQG